MKNQEFLLQSEEEIAESLGAKAKELRVMKNITQKAFAKKIGIPTITYGKFERTGIISLVSFLKVLRHLGKLTDISELLSFNDIEKIGVKQYLENESKSKRVRASGGVIDHR